MAGTQRQNRCQTLALGAFALEAIGLTILILIGTWGALIALIGFLLLIAASVGHHFGKGDHQDYR